ncbi:MAG: type II secretion system protein [Candidatus Dependentiae bacterium]|nr:type II secretion system protein [Candidatus Dependentiae bacterium]
MDKRLGLNKSGFTLIELMVAIALIGLLATIVIPNFQGAQPGYERKQFIAKLNALVNYGRQHAITSHQLYQIFVDFKQKKIELRVQAEQKNNKGEVDYKNVVGASMNTTISIPEAVDIKNFIIEDGDLMDRRSGDTTKDSWFFIVPDGLTQEVTINFFDTKDRMYDGKPRPVGLVLNPFTAQFKEYDTFQK